MNARAEIELQKQKDCRRSEEEKDGQADEHGDGSGGRGDDMKRKKDPEGNGSHSKNAVAQHRNKRLGCQALKKKRALMPQRRAFSRTKILPRGPAWHSLPST